MTVNVLSTTKVDRMLCFALLCFALLWRCFGDGSTEGVQGERVKVYVRLNEDLERVTKNTHATALTFLPPRQGLDTHNSLNRLLERSGGIQEYLISKVDRQIVPSDVF